MNTPLHEIRNGDIVNFSALQIGDYFRDETNQKFRKVPQFELSLPNSPPKVFNSFHIQSHVHISIERNEKVIFIKHSPWIEKQHFGFQPSIEESELGHRIEFLQDYLDTLDNFLIMESEDPFDYEHDAQRIDEFTDLLYSLFFVSLYSFLESQLDNECRHRSQNRENLRLSISDLHGKGIVRAKTYLVKVLGTTFPFENDVHWQRMHWYNKIRNAIVHKEGIVSDPKLMEYIEHEDGLSYQVYFGKNHVTITRTFCESVLKNVEALLRSLLYDREADEIE